MKPIEINAKQLAALLFIFLVLGSLILYAGFEIGGTTGYVLGQLTEFAREHKENTSEISNGKILISSAHNLELSVSSPSVFNISEGKEVKCGYSVKNSGPEYVEFYIEAVVNCSYLLNGSEQWSPDIAVYPTQGLYPDEAISEVESSQRYQEFSNFEAVKYEIIVHDLTNGDILCATRYAAYRPSFILNFC